MQPVLGAFTLSGQAAPKGALAEQVGRLVCKHVVMPIPAPLHVPTAILADHDVFYARRSRSRQSLQVRASAQNPALKAQQAWRSVKNDVDYKVHQLKQQFM